MNPLRKPTALKILEAARLELVENRGSLEMAQVARRAGVSVGLAYHHFGSKTGLMVAVIDDFYAELSDIMLGDAIPVDQDWLVREKARTKAMIDHFYSHPLAPLIAGRLAREPEVIDMETAHLDALLSAGAKNIQQGQRMGVVSSELDSMTIVSVLMGGLRLAIDRAVTNPNRPDPNQLLEHLWAIVRGTISAPDLNGQK